MHRESNSAFGVCLTMSVASIVAFCVGAGTMVKMLPSSSVTARRVRLSASRGPSLHDQFLCRQISAAI